MKWLGDARYEIDCWMLETKDDPEGRGEVPNWSDNDIGARCRGGGVETLYRSQGKVSLTYVVAKGSGCDIYFLPFPLFSLQRQTIRGGRPFVRAGGAGYRREGLV